MNVSQNGLDLIEEFEGIVLKAYPDPGSKNGYPWTIGVGHTKGVKRGDTCTKEQALEWLRQDAYETAQDILNCLPNIQLNQNQLDALTCFVYNIGITNFKKSTVRKMILKGNYAEAANAFGMWDKNDGKVMKGLVRRRAAEKALFLKPVENPPVAAPQAKIERIETVEVKPDTAITPQKVDKPLSTSREIGAGIALGGTAIVNTINSLTPDDLSQAQTGLQNVHAQVVQTDNHLPFGSYIGEGLSILIFLIGVFVIWKRIQDRRSGKR